MQNSIVPETGQVVYQVLDDLGTNGHVWPEMAENGWQTLPLLCGAFGYVCYWHLADIDLCAPHVCF